MVARHRSLAALVMAFVLSIPHAGLADNESTGPEPSRAESSDLEPGQARGMLDPPLRERGALMIASWVTFGVSWLATALSGIGGVAFEIDNAGWWTVPLAGPWVMVSSLHDPGEQADPIILFPIAMGVLQAVGLTMGVAWTIAYCKGRRQVKELVEKKDLTGIQLTDELSLEGGIIPGPHGTGTVAAVVLVGRF